MSVDLGVFEVASGEQEKLIELHWNDSNEERRSIFVRSFEIASLCERTDREAGTAVVMRSGQGYNVLEPVGRILAAMQAVRIH